MFECNLWNLSIFDELYYTLYIITLSIITHLQVLRLSYDYHVTTYLHNNTCYMSHCKCIHKAPSIFVLTSSNFL